MPLLIRRPLVMLSVGAVLLACTACSVSGATAARPVVVRFLGHSSFVVTAPDGTRVVSDPYSSIPIAYPTGVQAELVTVSHPHPDHLAVELVGGDPEVVMTPGVTTRKGDLEVIGYPGKHGLNMGNNTIFVYRSGGVKIVHLAELGEAPAADVMTAIQDADVMFVPAGAASTLAYDQLYALAAATRARVIVPEHFYSQGVLDDFLAAVPAGMPVVHDAAALEVRPGAVTAVIGDQREALGVGGKTTVVTMPLP